MNNCGVKGQATGLPRYIRRANAIYFPAGKMRYIAAQYDIFLFSQKCYGVTRFASHCNCQCCINQPFRLPHFFTSRQKNSSLEEGAVQASFD